MKKVYTVAQLIERLERLVNTHTVYATGAFGASIADFPDQCTRYSKNMFNAVYNEDIAAGKTKAYATSDAEVWKNKVITAAKTSPCFAFDCIGMVEAISAWEFSFDKKSVYGGSQYCSNGVDEWGTGSYGIITHCEGVSTDFSNIVPGELLWLNGHVGIYIGDGMEVECTTGWDDCVQKVECWNVKKTGKGRKWDKHGKMPWIDYTAVPVTKYSVEIGDYKTKAEAEKIQSALKVLGTDSKIVTK